jgi:hypothetical protein
MEATDENVAVPEKAKASNKALTSMQKVKLWSCVCTLGLMAVAGILIYGDEFFMMRCPHGSPVSARARDIYVAITSANTEREPLGLGNIWPKTVQKAGVDTSTVDIGTKIFTNSSDYFYEIYDGPNMGTVNHDPYVKGFDFSKLAGAGVPAKVGDGRLTAKNNMWLIAANITEEDDDIIPLLITRNVDVKEIERYINHSGGRAPDDTRIELGKGAYKTPFGKKGFVMVRKGGGTFSNQAKYATLRVLFNSQTLPPRDPSKPPIVYLMP